MAVPKSSQRKSWSMFVAAHRAQVPRRRNRHGCDRVLIVARDPLVRQWIEHELFGEAVSSQIIEQLAELVTCMSIVPPPWLQFLIVDLDEVSPADLDLVVAIRDAGWPCVVIAIGAACNDVDKSLGIDVVLPRTLGIEVLRNTIKRVAREVRNASESLVDRDLRTAFDRRSSARPSI